MTRCLLEPFESLRLCFGCKLPGRWIVGEPVPIEVVLENEAGVRVRKPHSHRVLKGPQSETVRQGERVGIPLRVALGGSRSEDFFCSVEGYSVENDEQERAGCTTSGLFLDLSTGKAKGLVTIFLSREVRLVPPGVEGERVAAINSKREAASAVDEAANGEANDGISLQIAFTPEWTARFNRPVLPLESLPSRIAMVDPHPKHTPSHGEIEVTMAIGSAAGGETLQPSPMAKQPAARGTGAPSWPGRDYVCNVRRLFFAVLDYQPRREDESMTLGSGNQMAPEDLQVDATTAEPKPNSERIAGIAVERLSLSEAIEARTTTVPTITYSTISSSSSTHDTIELSIVESVSLGGYFGTVWDCSLALGAFLASIGPRFVEGKRVVELGAGCGVASAVCAALGAREVVATDTGDLLPLLRLNMERLERRRRREGNRRSIEVEEYTWGSPLRDWHALARGKFDVIIASDLLFDPAYWSSLKESFSMLVGGSSSVIYLAHRMRNVQECEFFSSLEGFRYQKVAFQGEGEKERGRDGGGVDVDGCLNGTRWNTGCFPDVALYELRPIDSIVDATERNACRERYQRGVGHEGSEDGEMST